MPLGPEHNARDHAAWSSSIDHIRATPGFADWPWPHPMTLAENLADLEAHARDFAERSGFTYAVLDPETAAVYVQSISEVDNAEAIMAGESAPATLAQEVLPP